MNQGYVYPGDPNSLEPVPPVAEQLLYYALPARLREQAMGDLEEEYHLRMMSTPSRVGIRWWYRTQVIKSLATFMWEEKGGFMALFWSFIFFIGLTVVVIIYDFANFSFTFHNFVWFIDIPSFIVVLIPALMFARAVTSKGLLKLSFQLAFSDLAQVEIPKAKEACRFLQVCGNICVYMGWFGTAAGWIIIGHAVEDYSKYGPSFAIAAVTLFYGYGFKVCFYAVEQKIQNRFMND